MKREHFEKVFQYELETKDPLTVFKSSMSRIQSYPLINRLIAALKADEIEGFLSLIFHSTYDCSKTDILSLAYKYKFTEGIYSKFIKLNIKVHKFRVPFRGILNYCFYKNTMKNYGIFDLIDSGEENLFGNSKEDYTRINRIFYNVSDDERKVFLEVLKNMLIHNRSNQILNNYIKEYIKDPFLVAMIDEKGRISSEKIDFKDALLLLPEQIYNTTELLKAKLFLCGYNSINGNCSCCNNFVYFKLASGNENNFISIKNRHLSPEYPLSRIISSLKPPNSENIVKWLETGFLDRFYDDMLFFFKHCPFLRTSKMLKVILRQYLSLEHSDLSESDMKEATSFNNKPKNIVQQEPLVSIIGTFEISSEVETLLISFLKTPNSFNKQLALIQSILKSEKLIFACFVVLLDEFVKTKSLYLRTVIKFIIKKHEEKFDSIKPLIIEYYFSSHFNKGVDSISSLPSSLSITKDGPMSSFLRLSQRSQSKSEGKNTNMEVFDNQTSYNSYQEPNNKYESSGRYEEDNNKLINTNKNQRSLHQHSHAKNLYNSDLNSNKGLAMINKTTTELANLFSDCAEMFSTSPIGFINRNIYHIFTTLYSRYQGFSEEFISKHYKYIIVQRVIEGAVVENISDIDVMVGLLFNNYFNFGKLFKYSLKSYLKINLSHLLFKIKSAYSLNIYNRKCCIYKILRYILSFVEIPVYFNYIWQSVEFFLNKEDCSCSLHFIDWLRGEYYDPLQVPYMMVPFSSIEDIPLTNNIGPKLEQVLNRFFCYLKGVKPKSYFKECPYLNLKESRSLSSDLQSVSIGVEKRSEFTKLNTPKFHSNNSNLEGEMKEIGDYKTAVKERLENLFKNDNESIENINKNGGKQEYKMFNNAVESNNSSSLSKISYFSGSKSSDGSNSNSEHLGISDEEFIKYFIKYYSTNRMFKWKIQQIYTSCTQETKALLGSLKIEGVKDSLMKRPKNIPKYIVENYLLQIEFEKQDLYFVAIQEFLKVINEPFSPEIESFVEQFRHTKFEVNTSGWIENREYRLEDINLVDYREFLTSLFKFLYKRQNREYMIYILPFNNNVLEGGCMCLLLDVLIGDSNFRFNDLLGMINKALDSQSEMCHINSLQSIEERNSLKSINTRSVSKPSDNLYSNISEKDSLNTSKNISNFYSANHYNSSPNVDKQILNFILKFNTFYGERIVADYVYIRYSMILKNYYGIIYSLEGKKLDSRETLLLQLSYYMVGDYTRVLGLNTLADSHSPVNLLFGFCIDRNYRAALQCYREIESEMMNNTMSGPYEIFVLRQLKDIVEANEDEDVDIQELSLRSRLDRGFSNSIIYLHAHKDFELLEGSDNLERTIELINERRKVADDPDGLLKLHRKMAYSIGNALFTNAIELEYVRYLRGKKDYMGCTENIAKMVLNKDKGVEYEYALVKICQGRISEATEMLKRIINCASDRETKLVFPASVKLCEIAPSTNTITNSIKLLEDSYRRLIDAKMVNYKDGFELVNDENRMSVDYKDRAEGSYEGNRSDNTNINRCRRIVDISGDDKERQDLVYFNRNETRSNIAVIRDERGPMVALEKKDFNFMDRNRNELLNYKNNSVINGGNNDVQIAKENNRLNSSCTSSAKSETKSLESIEFFVEMMLKKPKSEDYNAEKQKEAFSYLQKLYFIAAKFFERTNESVAMEYYFKSFNSNYEAIPRFFHLLSSASRRDFRKIDQMISTTVKYNLSALIPFYTQISNRISIQSDSQKFFYCIIKEMMEAHPFETYWNSQILVNSKREDIRASMVDIVNSLSVENKLIFKNVMKAASQFTLISQKKSNQLSMDDFPSVRAMFPMNIPVPGKKVCINGVENSIFVFTSLQSPKKIILRGEDGVSYPIIVKYKDDLRKDSRFMDLDNLLNKIFDDGYYIRSYNVIPFTHDSGLIEFVPGLCSIKEICIKYYKDLNEMLAQFTKSRKIGGNNMKTILDKYKPIMLSHFKSIYNDPYTFYKTRESFIKTYAIMNIVGWFMGLGDRHAENIHIDLNTGDTVHVDLNCIFDKGKTFAIPETVPFRLTQNIMDNFGVLGLEGTYLETCRYTLSVMKRNKDVILANLLSFVFDPLFEWGRKKSEPKRIIDTLAEKLDFEDEYEKVHELIEEATDMNNLGNMYIGWMPFM